MGQKKYDDEDVMRYIDIVHEKFKDETQIVLEIVSDTNQYIRTLPTRNEFNEVKADIRMIKIALSDTNRDLKQHEKRLRHLERTVYHA